MRLKPDYAAAHNNLGNAWQDQGQLAEAIACYRRALQFRPEVAEAHNNLGLALKHLGETAEAIACYRRALELRPDNVTALNNLGVALQEEGEIEPAIAAYRRALQLKPRTAGIHSNLGTALKDRGQLGEAIACYRRALELEPDYAAAHSNLLYALQYREGVTCHQLAEVHADYDLRHAAPLRAVWQPHENPPLPRPAAAFGVSFARLGPPSRRFLSDPRTREPQPLQAEIVCYSDRTNRDELTAHFRAAAAAWHDVAGCDDHRLAAQIRGDKIDILFDLAGHTARAGCWSSPENRPRSKSLGSVMKGPRA